MAHFFDRIDVNDDETNHFSMVKVWFIIQLKRCQKEMVGFRVPSLKLTVSSHLKMDGWNTIRLPFGAKGLFFKGANLLLV